jgi:MFS family permease
VAGIIALAVAYVLSQFYRTFLAVLSPVLLVDLGATKSDLSVASGAWFIAFALMQFGVGIALDRHGPRRTASLMLGIAGTAGAVLFAMAGSPLMLTVAMVLIGIGCSPVLMAAFYLFARNFEPMRFASLSSTFIAVGLAGNVLGAAPLAQAAEAFGWRPVMAGLAVVTALSGLAIHLLVSDPEATADGRSSGLSGYRELLSMRVLWPILPLMLVAYSVVVGIRGLWAGPYLAEVYGSDALAIGNATLAMAIAMVIGTFAYGPLDRVFGTRKWLMAAGMALVVACTAALALAPAASWTLSVLLMVAIGFLGTNYAILMTHARAFFPDRLVGRGVTLMNFFSIGGVGLMQPLSGRVLSATAGNPAASQYATLFGFYAIVAGIALVIYLFSRDMPPK